MGGVSHMESFDPRTALNKHGPCGLALGPHTFHEASAGVDQATVVLGAAGGRRNALGMRDNGVGTCRPSHLESASVWPYHTKQGKPPVAPPLFRRLRTVAAPSGVAVPT
jgi:hypothetical protein